jgi:hypothetical protein
MCLVGAGLGLTLSPTNTDALARVDEADRSQASGVVQTVRVAVIGSIVLTVGDRAGPGRTATADAIAAGFVCAAAAFALAVLVGAIALSHATRT